MAAIWGQNRHFKGKFAEFFYYCSVDFFRTNFMLNFIIIIIVLY